MISNANANTCHCWTAMVGVKIAIFTLSKGFSCVLVVNWAYRSIVCLSHVLTCATTCSHMR